MQKQSDPIKEHNITAVNLYIECCNDNNLPVFQYTLRNIEKWNAKNKRYGGDIPYSAYILLAKLMHPDFLDMVQEEKKETAVVINKKNIDGMAIVLARKNAKREEI